MPEAPTMPGIAPSRGRSIAVWVLRGLVALLFLAAAAMKLTGQPMMVAEFNTIGLGQGFRILTGTLEVIGALAVLTPRYSALGALLLLAVDVGAFVAQVRVLHMDWIHTIVIGAILALLIYLQRGSLAALRR